MIDTTESQILFSHNCKNTEEIRKNVKAIIETAKGTMPGSRAFGLNNDFLSYPPATAQNLMAVEIANEIDEYEPRVTVASVEFEETSEQTILIPKIKLEERDGE